MSDNVIPLGNITRLDSNPDFALDAAKGNVKSIVILGWDNDDELFFKSSIADGGTVIWLIEQAKKALLEVEV